MLWSAGLDTITPTATADGTNLANSTYFGSFYAGGTRVRVYEITLGGQEPSTSSPTYWVFSRDSTVPVGFISGPTVALVEATQTADEAVISVGNSWGTTLPQRSSTLHLLNVSVNGLGGTMRWITKANYGLSIAASASASLSAFTGGTPGAFGGHVIYNIA